MSQEETPESSGVSKALILEELRNLIVNIKNEKYDKTTLGEIYSDMKVYTTDESNFAMNPEMVRYLFVGWWVCNGILRMENNEEPLLVTNEGSNLPICPWCLRQQSLDCTSGHTSPSSSLEE